MTWYHTHSIIQKLEEIFPLGIPSLLTPAFPALCCMVTSGHIDTGFILLNEEKNVLGGWVKKALEKQCSLWRRKHTLAHTTDLFIPLPVSKQEFIRLAERSLLPQDGKDKQY